ncbi:MAG: arsenate reductase family protein [Sulfurovum sp.]|nr:arsenate reductase family protein [Sulfurovum sp.]MCB4766261.1 arsenate reductase family protein [Sulfurovum sp.]MCB4777126.1 arsenate reductase family protein [Sulfurovum sp.]
MINIYGIKNCNSVQKALKFFKSYNIPHIFIDFRQTPVDEKDIRSWLEKSNLETILNTKGTTYRTLKLKALNLNNEEKIVWLARENMLIKRPVIVFDNQVIVGYNESTYLEKLLHFKG